MSTVEYEAIVHHCIKTGELWEDPEFPAIQSSVFYHQTPPSNFQWKRPHVSNFLYKQKREVSFKYNAYYRPILN